MRTLAFLLFTIFSANSYANYTCSGKVNGVSIEPSTGSVLVESIGPLSWPRLCRVDAEHNDISAEACRIIYSTLLTAQTTQKEVTFWFRDGKDCSEESHTPWGWLTGWYFGPQLVN